jgi:hypothetical protein
VLQASPLFPARVLLLPLALSTLCVTAYPQAPASTNQKLSLSAALVLTPEFCATQVVKEYTGTFHDPPETLEIGKAACTDLEPALKEAFFRLTRVNAESSSGDAQVLLLPRIAGANLTAPPASYRAKREVVVLLEWTIKDKSGKTVWLETVQGTAAHPAGRMGHPHSIKENLVLTTEDSMKNAAEQSASKMASSPELQKLASKGSMLNK